MLPVPARGAAFPVAALFFGLSSLVSGQHVRDTFGVSYKAVAPDGGPWMPETEMLVFKTSCNDTVFGCAMDYFWAGGGWNGYYDSRIHYYVDGEVKASVNLPFGLAHGSNMADDDGPWSAGAQFGKTGQPSGIFNTYKVPFQRSIVVTIELSAGGTRFWLVLRGRSGVPVRIGGEAITGPTSTNGHYRLQTYENSDTSVAKDALLPLLNSTAATGAVFMVVLAVTGFTSELFLEGCFRAHDPETQDVRYLLSSGTEDYFLGTYYFNRGKYTNPVAGLTTLNSKKGNATSFSAYHVHDQDPLYFVDGMLMTWRNSDPEACDLGGTRAGEAVKASSLALVYEEVPQL